MKAKTYQLELPGNLEIADGELNATGDFVISHSDIGLTPFSVPGGLSKVADELRFVFFISANKPL